MTSGIPNDGTVNPSWFKNGHVFTKEVLEKNRIAHIGKKHSEKTKKLLREIGLKSGIRPPIICGKFKDTSDKPILTRSSRYATIHQWVVRWRGRPAKCEHCGKDGLTERKIHWANIDHKYRRNLNDYIRLCAKCHKNYDKTLC